MQQSTRRLIPALLALLALACARAPAQSGCYHFGSVAVAATWEPSPVALDCRHAPSWPQWHLFTPGHRMPCTHVGFNPGDARELPRVIVIYRCTGFLFVPVVVSRVRSMGFVIDQPEYPCWDD